MANPNKTVARFMAKRGRDPRVVASIQARFAQSDFSRDLTAFQRGEMSADEFRRRHDPQFRADATD